MLKKGLADRIHPARKPFFVASGESLMPPPGNLLSSLLRRISDGEPDPLHRKTLYCFFAQIARARMALAFWSVEKQ